jgi:hypothetical protein
VTPSMEPYLGPEALPPVPGGKEGSHAERAEAARQSRLRNPALADAMPTQGRCTECQRPIYRLFGRWRHNSAAVEYLGSHKATPPE